MPTIVYQTNPTTGVKYAYESVSYWDKAKKAPRSKRKYLGRVDPETGEIIKASRRKKTDTASASEDSGNNMRLKEELEQKDAEITKLRDDLEAMTSRFHKAVRILKEIHALTDSAGED